MMVHNTPIMFTAFMFIGEPIFGAALILLLAAQVIELRSKGLV
jgi:hypothetical protein